MRYDFHVVSPQDRDLLSPCDPPLLACITLKTALLNSLFFFKLKTLIKDQKADNVKLKCYEEGEIGIYADHSAFIYTLKPGLLQIETADKQQKSYFGKL